MAACRLRTCGVERVRVRLRVGLGIGLGLGFGYFIRVEKRSADPAGRCRRVLRRGGGLRAGVPRTWHSLSVAYSLRAMLSDA